MNNYRIKYNDNVVEMTKPNSTMLIYKIPYKNIEKNNLGFVIPQSIHRVHSVRPE